MNNILIAIDPGLAHTGIVACTAKNILSPEYSETITTPATKGIDALHDRVATIADLLVIEAGRIKDELNAKRTRCVVLTTLFVRGKANQNSNGLHKSMGVAVGVASALFNSYDVVRDQTIIAELRWRGYDVPKDKKGEGKKVKTPFVRSLGWKDCPNGHVADAWLAVLWMSQLFPHQLKEM